MNGPTHIESGRILRFLRVACLAALFLAVTARAFAEERPSEYQIKAAFLYNFANFTTWPDSAFYDPDAPLVIAVLGDDPFGHHLDVTNTKPTTSGRPIEIVRAQTIAELPRCHILYICGSNAPPLSDILEYSRRRAILTIGETVEGCRQGLMISFFSEENKIRFHVNLDSIESSVLRIDPRVLKLGRPVAGGGK